MTKEELQKENDEKKEYLKSYIGLVKRTKLLQVEIEELRLSKMYPSSSNDGMPHGNGNGDLSGYMVAVDELEQSLMAARYDCICKYTEILEKIEILDDIREKNLLTLRYIKGLNWNDICEAVSYEWTQVHRIHGKALKHFQI